MDNLDNLSSFELLQLVLATKQKPNRSDADDALIKRGIELFKLKTAGQRARPVCRPAEYNIRVQLD